MANVKATFKIRRDRSDDYPADDEHGEVHVSEIDYREITLSRELQDVEDAVWAIEAKEYEVIWDLWEHVSDDQKYEEWGFYSPYPSGDVKVNLNYEVGYHEVVAHIAEREDADRAGVYAKMAGNRRIFGDPEENPSHVRFRGMQRLCEYLSQERGVDTSYWAHGREAGKGSSWGGGDIPEE